MKENLRKQIAELAKVGREAYNADVSRFHNPELAECVGKNRIWQEIKEMQDRREPDFLTLEWYNWIHSGERAKQQLVRKCKEAILYRMACKKYRHASAM